MKMITSLGMKTTVLACIFWGLACGTATAQLERLPLRGGPGGSQDMQMIRSGALLIASFDSNHDFMVTDEEIETGARNTFAVADSDGNNVVSPLEQRAWAARISGEDNVLGNASLFVSMIPGQVSEDEFVAGLKIFSDRFRDEEGQIYFTGLTFDMPTRPADRPEGKEDLARLKRPNISDRPNGGSR